MNTNRVFTYYQTVVGMPDPQPMIDLWADTWTANGWIPCVLGLRDAMSHPNFQRYSVQVATYPTVNPGGYEMACYIRHMAMESVGGGLLTDYDVMNRGLRAPMVMSDDPVICEPTRVPCAVIGTSAAFAQVVGYLNRFTPSRFDELPDGRRHCSDMTILRRTPIQTNRLCVEHLCSGEPIENDPGDGWKDSPLIHFSTGSIMKLGMYARPKHEVIREVLDELPEWDGQLTENEIPQ